MQQPRTYQEYNQAYRRFTAHNRKAKKKEEKVEENLKKFEL